MSPSPRRLSHPRLPRACCEEHEAWGQGEGSEVSNRSPALGLHVGRRVAGSLRTCGSPLTLLLQLQQDMPRLGRRGWIGDEAYHLCLLSCKPTPFPNLDLLSKELRKSFIFDSILEI